MLSSVCCAGEYVITASALGANGGVTSFSVMAQLVKLGVDTDFGVQGEEVRHGFLCGNAKL